MKPTIYLEENGHRVEGIPDKDMFKANLVYKGKTRVVNIKRVVGYETK